MQQLEAELKRLRPLAPPRELAARIGGALGARQPRNLWWAWTALPIAAAAAVAFFLSRPAPPRESPGVALDAVSPPSAPVSFKPVFKPVAAENVLLAANDEGLVTLSDGSAARRVRQSYIDTITWKDPRSQASLTWSVPREEERVVPVVFQ